jgi:hypothetical protein
MVERTVRDREVGGSNPLAPTIFLLLPSTRFDFPFSSTFESASVSVDSMSSLPVRGLVLKTVVTAQEFTIPRS